MGPLAQDLWNRYTLIHATALAQDSALRWTHAAMRHSDAYLLARLYEIDALLDSGAMGDMTEVE